MIEGILANLGSWGDWETFLLGQSTTTSTSTAPSTDSIVVPDNTGSEQYRNPVWLDNGNTANYGSWSSWSRVTNSQTETKYNTTSSPSTTINVPSDTSTSQYQYPYWVLENDYYTYGSWSSWSAKPSGQSMDSLSSSPSNSGVSVPSDTDTRQYTNGRWVQTHTTTENYWTDRVTASYETNNQGSAQSTHDDISAGHYNTATKRYYTEGPVYQDIDGLWKFFYSISYYETRTRYYYDGYYDERYRSKTRVREWRGSYERRTRSLTGYTYHWEAQAERRFFNT